MNKCKSFYVVLWYDFERLNGIPTQVDITRANFPTSVLAQCHILLLSHDTRKLLRYGRNITRLSADHSFFFFFEGGLLSPTKESGWRNTSKVNLFDTIGNCVVRLAVLLRAKMDGHRQLLSVMLSVVQSPGDQGLLLTHFHSRARAGRPGRGR